MSLDTGLLTREEYEEVQALDSISSIRNLLSKLGKSPFKVGDYINCFDKKRNRLEYISEQVSYQAAIYKIVCIDNIGLVFVRKVCLKGTLHKKVECITLADSNKWDYVLDKSYADFLMLAEYNEKFNAFKYIKNIQENRKDVFLKNKRLSLATNSKRSINKWLNKMKPNDKIWMHPIYGKQPSSNMLEIESIRQINKHDFKIKFKSPNNYMGSWRDDINTKWFMHQTVWNVKPYDYKDMK